MRKKYIEILGIVITCVTAAAAIVLWIYVLSGGGRQATRTLDSAITVTHGGDPIMGRDLTRSFGCAACHEIPGIDGPRGNIGPSLSDFKTRPLIAGVMQNTPDNLMHWLENPPAIDPKTAMPNLGITPDQARDIAAYLYSLDP